jgi:4a-hydroxytetrahydrobiopterin dehydratase
MNRLSDTKIETELKRLSGWKRDGKQITKEWAFNDFSEAMQFINQVALLAEEQDHHPEIRNVYNRVGLILFTHDSDGLTEKDFKLAAAIDKLSLD